MAPFIVYVVKKCENTNISDEIILFGWICRKAPCLVPWKDSNICSSLGISVLLIEIIDVILSEFPVMWPRNDTRISKNGQ